MNPKCKIIFGTLSNYFFHNIAIAILNFLYCSKKSYCTSNFTIALSLLISSCTYTSLYFLLICIPPSIINALLSNNTSYGDKCKEINQGRKQRTDKNEAKRLRATVLQGTKKILSYRYRGDNMIYLCFRMLLGSLNLPPSGNAYWYVLSNIFNVYLNQVEYCKDKTVIALYPLTQYRSCMEGGRVIKL